MEPQNKRAKIFTKVLIFEFRLLAWQRKKKMQINPNTLKTVSNAQVMQRYFHGTEMTSFIGDRKLSLWVRFCDRLQENSQNKLYPLFYCYYSVSYCWQHSFVRVPLCCVPSFEQAFTAAWHFSETSKTRLRLVSCKHVTPRQLPTACSCETTTTICFWD